MENVNSVSKKALIINLNDSIFGTFAEIGGGQETVRYFFRAGGASTTIAKSISAYDKAFSDQIYNKGSKSRYVCEYRLKQMLKTEYSETISIIENKQKENINLFTFANTVETINFQKNNRSHGWLGIRYHINNQTSYNEVILHINLLEKDAILQQKTIGVIGVNLIYACFYYYDSPKTFLQSLMDDLDSSRIQIDMIRMTGPDLNYIDNRLLAVQLVKEKMTPAALFDRHGQVQQPHDMLYRKNMMVFRGNFRPITYVGFNMLKSAYAIFKKDEDHNKLNTLALCEMTLNNLLEKDGEIDERDFLDRVNILNGMGQNVMVTNFKEYYKLVGFFSSFKIKNIRIVIGIPTFTKVLNEKYYKELPGGILEAFGSLFIQNMKMYLYPTIDENDNIVTIDKLQFPEHINTLLKYLQQTRKIIQITKVRKDFLGIDSKEILYMIQNNISGWELKVPVYIEEYIKRNRLFCYEGDQKLINKKEREKIHCRKPSME
ncbi:MAG: hypothetical protein ACEPOW_02325 [Bacteroidales bacterium]